MPQRQNALGWPPVAATAQHLQPMSSKCVLQNCAPKTASVAVTTHYLQPMSSKCVLKNGAPKDRLCCGHRTTPATNVQQMCAKELCKPPWVSNNNDKNQR